MQVRGLVFSLPVALFLRFLLLSGVDEKEGFDCWLKDEDGVLVVCARQLHQALAQRLPQLI